MSNGFARSPPSHEIELTRSMKPDHLEEIRELIALLSKSNLTEIEVERKDFRVRVRRELPVAPIPSPEVRFTQEPPPLPMVQLDTQVSEASGLLTVTSPIVGTFYRSPSPDADCYVEEGDIVKKGQVICLVEAMKLMNEIEAEQDGRIVKILVENASSIEYGQPLFLIDPVVNS